LPSGYLALPIGLTLSGRLQKRVSLPLSSRIVRRGCSITIPVILLAGSAATAIAFYQARRVPEGEPVYVATGSSFAAGAGLGPLQHGSPWLCARSVNGYPQQLARRLGLPIVDMSCGGAVTRHILAGGQFFQGPQLRVIDEHTRLVTITVGGNDVGYIGDLSMLAARRTNTTLGWLVRHLWHGPKTDDQRHYDRLRADLISTIRAIRNRTPEALVVVATYPTILPASGACAQLDLSNSETDQMRAVAARLASTTKDAAAQAGALLVDMNQLGAGHDACSVEPWTNGWANGGIAPFHPNLRGATATAMAIADALRHSPAGIAAVSKNDAASHQTRSIGSEK
jgi:lysophospholipase L1-like esterase